jgi:hypothetical protein
VSRRQVTGLKAADAVKWLLKSEPDVMAAAQRFIAGELPEPRVRVAGPPSLEEVLRIRSKPPQLSAEERLADVRLPSVTLNFAIETVSDELTLTITTNLGDLDEIVSWQQLARMMAARRTAQAARLTSPVLRA